MLPNVLTNALIPMRYHVTLNTLLGISRVTLHITTHGCELSPAGACLVGWGPGVVLLGTERWRTEDRRLGAGAW